MKTNVFLTTFIGLSLVYILGFRINLTSSYPLGVYQITTSPPYQRGELVSFCPPSGNAINLALERGYVKHGTCSSGSTPLIKKIMATQGDTITFDSVISINGEALAQYPIHAADSLHRTLPKPQDLTLNKGEVLLLSDFAPFDSFDGRYFGAVSTEAILGRATPILTFKGG
ncbi:conjugative transfer signal peptidase TraF, partial [Vibrio jasicida]|uniref:Conjugative transfer signal peptidase TraF n=1 Tax=Vibrio jasicida TaxID=766224 RepID=A0AAU9QZ29_9VIBR|nr:Conjugative transfer signal peptidase TraF [Vibrio jasicida]